MTRGMWTSGIRSVVAATLIRNELSCNTSLEPQVSISYNPHHALFSPFQNTRARTAAWIKNKTNEPPTEGGKVSHTQSTISHTAPLSRANPISFGTHNEYITPGRVPDEQGPPREPQEERQLVRVPAKELVVQ